MFAQRSLGTVCLLAATLSADISVPRNRAVEHSADRVGKRRIAGGDLAEGKRKV